MKISLICNNENFLEYLSRATGVQVDNAYKTLTEEATAKRFAEEFNYVDVLLFIDFQDLAKEFTVFLKGLNEGKSYFLQAEEIILVTYEDPKLSPTPDLETNLTAITAFMAKLNYKFRVVRLSTLKFQDIFKSISSPDTIKENSVKKLIKYKVVANGEGVIIPPKKAKTTIVPDKVKGRGAQNKREDLQSAQALEGVTIDIPDIVERIRTEKDFKDSLSVTTLDSTTVFVTGLRYSGKTTISLLCSIELQKQNLTSAVIDSTGRKDLRMINNLIDSDMELMNGLSLDGLTGRAVVGVNVHSKVYSSLFLTNFLRHVLISRTVCFCEVDPEELSAMYKSFRGDKVVLVVTPNSATHIRDTINFANSLDFRVVPVVNNSFRTENSVNLKNLRDSFNNAKSIFSTESLSELISSLLK